MLYEEHNCRRLETMKGLIVIILIILAIAAVLFSGKPQPATPTRKPSTKRTTTRQQTSPPKQAESRPQQQRSTQSARESGAIESAINYGTGYTQMKVKKRQKNKLDQIQSQRNQNIDNATK